ncbi:hypothetical protein MAR_011671 [Mya arenaria]|uniref:B box-type domain-containing protein n=1 Tax=Mya arenaria TaxID=6604 RepID=A0ABY7FWG6_MYAAR|nr:uncharacterized protein LOC128217195 [Mya arenaria]WAR25967.1 hypothetical protein MAR_011671 [Mya arenaria]
MAFNVDSSLHKASDLIHEFTCSPCEEDGLYSEAQNFCVDCSKYYCYRCEPKHGGLFKRHSVLGRKDVTKWAAVPWTVVDDLERCEHHRGKKVELFCGDHQELCCQICVNILHRQCSLIHIPDVAKGIYDKPEVKRLPQQIANIQSQIKKQTGSRKNQQQCIRDSRTRILQEIRTLRSTIDNALNQLEQNTIKELDVMVATLEQQIKTNIKQFAQFSKDIKSLADYIAKGKMDDSLAYVGYSKCQKLIRETNAFVEDNKTKEKVNLEFVLNTGLNDVIAPLLSLRWFGEITDTSHVFTTEHVKRFNTAIASDREHNTISGICELLGGELVLVDNFNSCIKLLNQVYKVVDHCDVPTHPRDVCHIAGNELAVSVNSNIENRHEVRFFNVMNSKLQQTRKITFSHSVLKIAHHKGRMYIASGTALYSYDKASKDGGKLFEDKSDTLTVLKCAVSSDGSKIYVANYSKDQLLTLDSAGNKLATLSDPDMKSPRAIHVSPVGHVFVGSYGSNTVLQVDREGKRKLATLTTQFNGLVKPQSLCYCSRTSCLVVGQFDNNNVIVLKLK